VFITTLRQRKIEDFQLHGMAERAPKAYIPAVYRLARFYHNSSDIITEEGEGSPLREIRQYFLWMKNVKHYS
jgi:hypothetical protein